MESCGSVLNSFGQEDRRDTTNCEEVKNELSVKVEISPKMSLVSGGMALMTPSIGTARRYNLRTYTVNNMKW